MPSRVTENDAWLKAVAGFYRLSAALILARELFLVSNFGSVLVFSKYRSNGQLQASSDDVTYRYYFWQHGSLLSCIEHCTPYKTPYETRHY